MVKGLSMAHLKHKIEQLFQSGKEGPDIQELKVSKTATYNGKEILRTDNASNQPNLTFGNWKTASTERPALILLTARAVTDGTSRGHVMCSVDEDGTTGGEMTQDVRISAEHNTNSKIEGSMTLFVPPGGSYIVSNQSDPTGLNDIVRLREFIL